MQRVSATCIWVTFGLAKAGVVRRTAASVYLVREFSLECSIH